MSEALREQHGNRLNVIYLGIGQHRLLAMRYHARSNPTVLFYDRAGREARRHAGAIAQKDIETTLHEMGIE
ncbi:thioredoxin family protein [bacterium]|nr:thioredoxin family protein [bacterium]